MLNKTYIHATLVSELQMGTSELKGQKRGRKERRVKASEVRLCPVSLLARGLCQRCLWLWLWGGGDPSGCKWGTWWSLLGPHLNAGEMGQDPRGSSTKPGGGGTWGPGSSSAYRGGLGSRQEEASHKMGQQMPHHNRAGPSPLSLQVIQLNSSS